MILPARSASIFVPIHFPFVRYMYSGMPHIVSFPFWSALLASRLNCARIKRNAFSLLLHERIVSLISRCALTITSWSIFSLNRWADSSWLLHKCAMYFYFPWSVLLLYWAWSIVIAMLSSILNAYTTKSPIRRAFWPVICQMSLQSVGTKWFETWIWAIGYYDMMWWTCVVNPGVVKQATRW